MSFYNQLSPFMSNNTRLRWGNGNDSIQRELYWNKERCYIQKEASTNVLEDSNLVYRMDMALLMKTGFSSM